MTAKNSKAIYYCRGDHIGADIPKNCRVHVMTRLDKISSFRSNFLYQVSLWEPVDP